MRPRQVAHASLWGIGFVVMSACDHPLGGLIGETWLSNEFRVTNNTDTDFQIDEAVLLVGGQSIPMKRDDVDPSYWFVPAGGKDEHVLVTWDFADPAPRVLGSECVIVITAHRGVERGKLTVKYTRTH
jgi:hypothetical protein